MTELVEQVNANTTELCTFVEREDEKAIMNEQMSGELIQALVYIGNEGKPVASYAGVKEAARRYKNIEYGVSKTEITPEYIIAYGYARNLVDNISVEVPKMQPTKMTLKSGDTKNNDFAFEMACSKAIRNAIKAVIPIEYFQALISKFIAVNNGEEILKDAITPKQVGLLQAIFKAAELQPNDIHTVFSVESTKQITKKSLNSFFHECFKNSGRSTKPENMTDYSKDELDKIYAFIRKEKGLMENA